MHFNSREVCTSSICILKQRFEYPQSAPSVLLEPHVTVTGRSDYFASNGEHWGCVLKVTLSCGSLMPRQSWYRRGQGRVGPVPVKWVSQTPLGLESRFSLNSAGVFLNGGWIRSGESNSTREESIFHSHQVGACSI